eukprot:TRINITY_DN78169_c0_g1_i1.p1 TRINITY_DN78169_c0_g1~~TRINITY_DN78169_c0_g1_i1.p1  ORF type:complete len:619 (-),score=100.79 TRINITY_DN78169_c0_g1_i1:34-1890(-)
MSQSHVRAMRHCLWLTLWATVRPFELYDSRNYSAVQHAEPGTCRVLHLPQGPASEALTTEIAAHFDIIITDDASRVAWLTAEGKFYFLEDRRWPLGERSREMAQLKESAPLEWRRQGMSLLFPSSLHTEELQLLYQEASQLMPASFFVDDGTFETRSKAFKNFTYTVLLNLDGEPGTPPQSIVDAFSHGTVPIIIGKQHKLDYTHYFRYAVAKFKDFSLEGAITFMLSAPADALYVYANSAKIIQEFFYMRYTSPFEQRLKRHAEMACHALKQPTPPLAFVAIYSSKANFGRRMALRDTWLQLLKSHHVSYKFFLAGTLVDGKSDLDDILRRERDIFDDMVFLTGTTDEYPIGRKGLAALLWVAHHTDAQFWLKFDDDLYVRPQLLLSHLARHQRAEAYWGAFDYSGLVVRNESDAHYTSIDIWPDPVFPPYARGAALAMSMDLVRLIADQEEKQPFKKIKVEDVSYGFYLWQLAFERQLTSITILDRDELHFAMDAKCCTEATHPNNCWLPLSADTWIAHHVTPAIIRCMFAKDVEAGFYLPKSSETRTLQGILSDMAAYDKTVQTAVGVIRGSDTQGTGQAADLCDCVYTPPAHPGQPLQKGIMLETSSGPRLHTD